MILRNRYVLTGGPGTGKTSVVTELEKKGYNIVHEPARTLIDYYKANSPELLPALSKENRIKFALAIEKVSIENYLDNETGIFDRSILDEVGYRNRYNISISEALDKAAKEMRYNKVFIFPFWEEIFVNDDVRHESSEEAKIISEHLHKAYVNYGYTPIIVPKMGVIERVKFIMENI